MPEYLAHHLPHVTPSPHATGVPQYVGALQAHTPPALGAFIALTFIGLLIILCFRAGSRGGGRD